jgi:membrane-bound serine protease (ClpP class)
VLADPNVVYLILLVGLWASALAVYVPGTGFWEAIALSVLAAALFMLISMPTNWLAVLALVVGTLDFLMVPLYRQRLTLLALIGLIFQAVGGVLLFQGPSVSWLTIAISIGISFVFYQYVLLPAQEARSSQPVQDDEQLLPGSIGRVVKALDPVGTVNVRGELWTAYSDRPVQADDEVLVVRKEGLRLFVEKAKPKRKSEEPLEEGG